MKDDVLNNFKQQALEKRSIDVCNNIVALTSQGYVVNKAKYNKLCFSNMLIHILNNYSILSDKQKYNAQVLIDKVLML